MRRAARCRLFDSDTTVFPHNYNYSEKLLCGCAAQRPLFRCFFTTLITLFTSLIMKNPLRRGFPYKTKQIFISELMMIICD